jgi:ABC-type phosphate/phosphonate transport system substrate-binding protein
MRVFFDESLGQALKTKTAGRADLIIGKASVVRAQARTQQLKVSAVASLTGKDGLTTQTGLFVVAGKDPALTVADLKGYHLFLGPSDSEEKHGAALGLLKELGVAVDRQPEVCPACSDGANKVLDHHRQGEKGVAVISSYALALLEGCGNVKKGDLRLVGATAPVPFVVAFVNDRLPRPEREAISQALLRVGKVPDLCRALESQKGFVPLEIGKSLIQQDRR